MGCKAPIADRGFLFIGFGLDFNNYPDVTFLLSKLVFRKETVLSNRFGIYP